VVLRNESRPDEGQNPLQTSACARRATALGASPPVSGRRVPGPDEPVILGERSPRIGATLAAGRADRERDRLALQAPS
jgi:hypothetical protein